MKINIKTVVLFLMGISIGWVLMNVKIKRKTCKKKIEDKMIVGDRSGIPQYYIITKDSLGFVEQERTNVQDYAFYKVGKSYQFADLDITIKK